MCPIWSSNVETSVWSFRIRLTKEPRFLLKILDGGYCKRHLLYFEFFCNTFEHVGQRASPNSTSIIAYISSSLISRHDNFSQTVMSFWSNQGGMSYFSNWITFRHFDYIQEP